MLVSVGLSSDPLLPAWGVYPLGMLALVVLAGHVLALRRAPMPASRRRIRTANGLFMMLTIPVLSFAAGGVAPAEAAAFVIVWAGAILAVAVIALMGVIDVVNTLLLTRAARAHLRAELRRTRAQMQAIVESHHRTDASALPPGDRHDAG